MSVDRLLRRHDAGVSICFDTLSRERLDSGALARLIGDHALTGATADRTVSPGYLLPSPGLPMDKSARRSGLAASRGALWAPATASTGAVMP